MDKVKLTTVLILIAGLMIVLSSYSQSLDHGVMYEKYGYLSVREYVGDQSRIMYLSIPREYWRNIGLDVEVNASVSVSKERMEYHYYGYGIPVVYFKDAGLTKTRGVGGADITYSLHPYDDRVVLYAGTNEFMTIPIIDPPFDGCVYYYFNISDRTYGYDSSNFKYGGVLCYVQGIPNQQVLYVRGYTVSSISGSVMLYDPYYDYYVEHPVSFYTDIVLLYHGEYDLVSIGYIGSISISYEDRYFRASIFYDVVNDYVYLNVYAEYTESYNTDIPIYYGTTITTTVYQTITQYITETITSIATTTVYDTITSTITTTDTLTVYDTITHTTTVVESITETVVETSTTTTTEYITSTVYDTITTTTTNYITETLVETSTTTMTSFITETTTFYSDTLTLTETETLTETVYDTITRTGIDVDIRSMASIVMLLLVIGVSAGLIIIVISKILKYNQ